MLKDRFKDWLDWDGAEFELGVILGLWEGTEEAWIENKGIIWSANPLGNALCNCLFSLVEAELLEYDTDRQAYRWKNNE